MCSHFIDIHLLYTGPNGLMHRHAHTPLLNLATGLLMSSMLMPLSHFYFIFFTVMTQKHNSVSVFCRCGSLLCASLGCKTSCVRCKKKKKKKKFVKKTTEAVCKLRFPRAFTARRQLGGRVQLVTRKILNS